MPRPAGLLPSDPTRYGGPAVAYWITTIFLVVITARSLVHLFSPDGGARSIATIDTSVSGGDNIIAIFGQRGASQLLLVGALWVLLLRYPFQLKCIDLCMETGGDVRNQLFLEFSELR